MTDLALSLIGEIRLKKIPFSISNHYPSQEYVRTKMFEQCGGQGCVLANVKILLERFSTLVLMGYRTNKRKKGSS